HRGVADGMVSAPGREVLKPLAAEIRNHQALAGTKLDVRNPSSGGYAHTAAAPAPRPRRGITAWHCRAARVVAATAASTARSSAGPKRRPSGHSAEFSISSKAPHYQAGDGCSSPGEVPARRWR